MGNGGVGTVAEAVAALDSVLDELSGLPLPDRDDAAARESVAEMFRLVQRTQAEYLRHVADLDARAHAVPGARPGMVARSFLAAKLRRTVGEAARDVAAAGLLAQDAPLTRDALAAGRVSREHVDVLVRAMERVPTHLKKAVEADGTGTERIDAWYADTATRHASGPAKFLARHLLAHLDPDGEDRFDPLAYQRRTVSSVQDSTGMTVIHGQLDPANAAAWRLALQTFSAPKPTRQETAGDGSVVTVADTRTAGQRRADALGLMARLALAQANGRPSEAAQVWPTNRGGEPARILVHTTPEQLREALTPKPAPPDRVRRGGTAETDVLGPIDLTTLGLLACDALVARVLKSPGGKILDLGRDVRTVTSAQWRALVARDGGCAIPGCTNGPHLCQAHHVQWWSAGGRSDIDNYALVCFHHHAAIHARVWDLVMVDGRPWARPPKWIESGRRLVRNTYWDDRSGAAALAGALRHRPDPPDHHAA